MDKRTFDIGVALERRCSTCPVLAMCEQVGVKNPR